MESSSNVPTYMIELYTALDNKQKKTALQMIADLDISELETPYINGQTTMHWAAYGGIKEVVDILVKRGALINRKSGNGSTPLFIASKHGRLEAVKRLLEEKHIIVNEPQNGNCTPLFIACQNGHKEVVSLLLQNRACVHTRLTENGAMPLHIACQYGHVDIAEMLINNGAFVTATTKEGATPLYIAVASNNEKLAELLISKGADPEADPGYKGWNCAHVSISRGSRKMAELMFKSQNNISLKNQEGIASLHLAVFHNNTEAAQYLIENGADVDQLSDTIMTPLHYAAQRNNYSMTKMLLDADADPAIGGTRTGATAAHITTSVAIRNLIDIATANRVFRELTLQQRCFVALRMRGVSLDKEHIPEYIQQHNRIGYFNLFFSLSEACRNYGLSYDLPIPRFKKSDSKLVGFEVTELEDDESRVCDDPDDDLDGESDAEHSDEVYNCSDDAEHHVCSTVRVKKQRR